MSINNQPSVFTSKHPKQSVKHGRIQHFHSIFQVDLHYPVAQCLHCADLLELRVMEVAVTTGTIRHTKLQSKRHHQQTNIQLVTGRMPFLSPNQQC